MGKPGRPLTQKRILLVDNEQDILDILARVLVGAGYNVDMATDGRAALEQVSRRGYDLIISNMRMPVMSGEAFYRQLCTSHPNLSKRVVFCTGDIANASTHRFLNAAGAPVIFKPFQLRTVLDVVSRNLERVHSHSDLSGLPLVPPETVPAPAY